MTDPYDAKRDAESESRYDDGLVDGEVEVDFVFDPVSGEGTPPTPEEASLFMCVIDESAGMREQP